MPSRVYLLREINCYVGKQLLPDRWLFSLGLTRAARVESFASLWIANDPLDHDYETRALKLAGPLPIEETEQLLIRLRSVLEAAGVDVLEETVSDD